MKLAMSLPEDSSILYEPRVWMTLIETSQMVFIPNFRIVLFLVQEKY